MNKKAFYAFRIVLGGYLAYLGAGILIQMINERPGNMAFMIIVAVIFLIVGAGYAVFSLKKVLDIRKEEQQAEDGRDIMEEENGNDHEEE